MKPIDLSQEAIEELHAATALYTAEPLVDTLLDQLSWPGGGKKLVDPSCGDGMFLLRALERLLTISAPGQFTDFSELQGWEIHEQACCEARARLETRLVAFGMTMQESALVARSMVIHGDFLTGGPETPAYDYVAGNPPYLRWLNVPQLLREKYAGVVPTYASADMLHSFLDRCVKALRPGGQIGLVTADRWLSNANAAVLREEIGKRVSIDLVERVDASTAFYRPKTRKAGTPPRVSPVALILSDRRSKASIPITREPIYPGADPTQYKGVPLLSELATVRMAPWLGRTGVFVVDVDVAMGLPMESLVPVVDTRDLDGRVVGQPTHFAIKTMPGQLPAEAIRRHLLVAGAHSSPRAKRVAPWMPPETFHQWDLDRPSLLIPRVARNPKPIRVPAGRLPVNHNISIVCDSREQLGRIEAWLNTDAAAEWIHQRAPRLENGFYGINATLMRKMPVVLA